MNKQDPIKIRHQMIIEMIEASMDLSGKLGKHPLTNGCPCIACVIQRKRIIAPKIGKARFIL